MVNRVGTKIFRVLGNHAILMRKAMTIVPGPVRRSGVITSFRHFLLVRYRMAFVLIALALAVKALVPAGFMVEARGHVLTVAICADASGEHSQSRQIVIPGKPAGGQFSPAKSGQSKTGEACPFSALSMAGVSGADPALLALALGFILLLGFLPVCAPCVLFTRRIRPPLRAPPVLV